MIDTAIYKLATGSYFAAVRFASLFDHKAKLFVEGRKGLLDELRKALTPESRKRIWMHCASLGEFEQGRPVLEAIKAKYPGCAVILTFFSPSGYEVRKDYKGADYVYYLPTDTAEHAREFLDIVNPALCVFVKYEFWYYYLREIQSRKIPSILISSIFKPGQGFFKWYGQLQRTMLRAFTHIFVQDEASELLLQTIDISNVTVNGDTRFDRVIQAAHNRVALPVAETFARGHHILVAGSTWAADEQMLKKAFLLMPPNWKMIIVPHEVDGNHIAKVRELFSTDVILWSECELMIPVKKLNEKRILVVDRVGLLLHLYAYGRAVWIGGGFGKKGVHNVLEAAVFGVPCFYGPIFHQFLEARELIEAGGGETLDTGDALVKKLGELEHEKVYDLMSVAARTYVNGKGGATKSIMQFIESNHYF